MCTLHQLYKWYVESRRGWHFNLCYHIFSPVQDPAFQRPFCRPLNLLSNLPPPQKAKQPAKRLWSYPMYILRLMSITNYSLCLVLLLILQKQSQVSKVASVAGFIAEIQSSLSDEAFQTFKKALRVYKDVSCPYHCSCDHLWLLVQYVRSSLKHKLSVISGVCHFVLWLQSHDIYTFTEKLKEIFRHPSSFHLLKGRFYLCNLEPLQQSLLFHTVLLLPLQITNSVEILVLLANFFHSPLNFIDEIMDENYTHYLILALWQCFCRDVQICSWSAQRHLQSVLLWVDRKDPWTDTCPPRYA